MAASTPQRRALVILTAAVFLICVYTATTHLSSFTTRPSPMSLAGGHKRPSANHPLLLGRISEDLIPTKENGRRLVVVGDIHGMDAELAALLKKVDFKEESDHLVATGDVINKGPASAAVVSRLMAMNATSVRGNHEDQVLRAWAKATAAAAEPQEDESKFLAVARTLSEEHMKWLSQRPIILSAEPLPVFIVHAGLVPGLALRKQDPWAVMNMRTLLRPSHKRESNSKDDQDTDDVTQGVKELDISGIAEAVPIEGREGQRWAKAWNQYQKHLKKADRRTVVYGHDAKTGYVQGDYTFGLDSACVRGGALTALVVEAKGHGFKYKKVQVHCQEA